MGSEASPKIAIVDESPIRAAILEEGLREAGYTAAVSTARGVATPQDDCFQLPRFSPWHHEENRLRASLLRNAAFGSGALRVAHPQGERSPHNLAASL